MNRNSKFRIAVRAMIRKWRTQKEVMKFHYQRRFRDLPTLYFDFGSKGATDFIKAGINQSDIYVEFGAGASTIYAANCKAKTISIEADYFFARKIQRLVEPLDGANCVEILFRDLGPIKMWCRPLGFVTFNRRQKFARYSEFPTSYQLNGKEVFVLIDGRFRVATALKAGRALANSKNYTIVVDDCAGRQYYQLLCKHFKESKRIGRLGIFKKANINEASYTKTLQLYEHQSD